MKPQKYRCALLVMVLLVAWRHECYAGADDQPSEQSGSNCQNSFYEDRDSVLLARHLGSLFDSKTALKHLRQITGLLPIIEQHCIRDRCTEPNKDFFRAFLIEYLKGLGYSGQDIKFEYQGKVLSYGELLAKSTALRNKEFSHPRLTFLMDTSS